MEQRISRIHPASLMLSPCPSASKHRACKTLIRSVIFLIVSCPLTTSPRLQFTAHPALQVLGQEPLVCPWHGLSFHFLLLQHMLFLGARSLPDDKRILKTTKSYLGPLQRKSSIRTSLCDHRNLFIYADNGMMKQDNDL